MFKDQAKRKILWKVSFAVSGTNENLSLSNLPGTTAEPLGISVFRDHSISDASSPLLRYSSCLMSASSGDRYVHWYVTPCTAPRLSIKCWYVVVSPATLISRSGFSGSTLRKIDSTVYRAMLGVWVKVNFHPQIVAHNTYSGIDVTEISASGRP